MTEAEFLSSLLDCVFPPGYLLHVAQPSNTFLVSRHNTRWTHSMGSTHLTTPLQAVEGLPGVP